MTEAERVAAAILGQDFSAAPDEFFTGFSVGVTQLSTLPVGVLSLAYAVAIAMSAESAIRCEFSRDMTMRFFFADDTYREVNLLELASTTLGSAGSVN